MLATVATHTPRNSRFSGGTSPAVAVVASKQTATTPVTERSMGNLGFQDEVAGTESTGL